MHEEHKLHMRSWYVPVYMSGWSACRHAVPKGTSTQSRCTMWIDYYNSFLPSVTNFNINKSLQYNQNMFSWFNVHHVRPSCQKWVAFLPREKIGNLWKSIYCTLQTSNFRIHIPFLKWSLLRRSWSVSHVQTTLESTAEPVLIQTPSSIRGKTIILRLLDSGILAQQMQASRSSSTRKLLPSHHSLFPTQSLEG